MSEIFQIFALQESTHYRDGYSGEKQWVVFIAGEEATIAFLRGVLTLTEMDDLGLRDLRGAEWAAQDFFKADTVKDEDGKIIRFDNIQELEKAV